MILEITKDERILILRGLFREAPLHDPQITALANRLMELRENGTSTGQSSASAVMARPGGTAVATDRSGSRGDQGSIQPEKAEHTHSRAESMTVPHSLSQTPESVRWASGKYDRDSVEQITLTPSMIKREDVEKAGEKPTPRLTVSWQNRQGRGYLYASAWDMDLFPWIAARAKQETAFYVVHKGKYTNIVGVKA